MCEFVALIGYNKKLYFDVDKSIFLEKGWAWIVKIYDISVSSFEILGVVGHDPEMKGLVLFFLNGSH